MYITKAFIYVLVLVICFTGCTNNKQLNSIKVKSRPIVKNVKEYSETSNLLAASRQLLNDFKPNDEITLKQVLSHVLMRNPELVAFSWELRAIEAKKLQVNLFPNPELDIESENFGGTGDFQGTNSMETTIQLSQLVELGGKRNKRKKLADLEYDLVGMDYEVKRLNVFTKATISFIYVLASQERLTLAENMLGLAQQVHNTVSERVKSGKVSPIEEIKTNIVLNKNQLEFERSKSDLKTARKILAATWGSTTPVFKKVSGDINIISSIPSFKLLSDLVDKHPHIARRALEVEKSKMSIKSAKAYAIPDLTLHGGFKQINQSDDTTFVVGITVPLPLFSRNQGEILESKYRLLKAKEEQKVAMVQIHTTLAKIYQNLSTVFSEIETWKNKILPGAQIAFDSVKEGYRFGKFGLLDVLDGQKTLFESNSRYIDKLVEFHNGVTELEWLIGTPLRDIKISGEIK